MTRRSRRLAITLVALPVFAVTLAGCTETVDPKSAESIIKTNIPSYGPYKAKSVSCPDNVKKKQGVAFSCKVTLQNTTNGATGTGTITLHIVSGGKKAIFYPTDVHVK